MSILPKIQFASICKEEVKGTTYTYSEGFGQLTKAGATVQKGAEVTAHVAIEMKAITNEQTQSWFNENKTTYTDEQQKEIQSHLDEGNTSSAWWAIFAWGASGDHTKNEWKTEKTLDVHTTDQQQTNIVNSLSKEESKYVKVTGDIKITGTSYLPTTAFIFAQISTITYADGTTAQVIDGTPEVADAHGDTSGAKVNDGQKLNIVPIM